MPPHRLAFIGGFGHHLLRPALADDATPIAAVAVAGDGRDNAAAQRRFAPILDQADWYDDPIAMLDRFQPTVVNVGGVFGHNARLSIEALRRGIAVISEKPIAASWDDLAALRHEAEQPGRVLLCEFSFRSAACFRAARQAVSDGRVGRVALATAQKSYRFGEARPDFYRRRADYGSTLLWVASHGVDALHFTTRLPFTHVYAAHDNLTRPDYASMEDHCAAIFGLAGGATGLVHADFLRPAAAATHGDDRLRIAGSQGVLEIREGRCLLTTHDQPEQDITDTVQPEPIHRELLAAVQQGGSEFYNTPEALSVAAALLAARDAADGGRVVAIEGGVEVG